MRIKNFKILEILALQGLKQSDLVKNKVFSHESRASRVINRRDDPTPLEIEKLSQLLDEKPENLGF